MIGTLQTYLGRRRFLVATASLAGFNLPQLASAVESDAVVLRPLPNLELFRVRMELEVEGNVSVPDNSLASRKSSAKLPIKSRAVFDYEERYRRPSGADPTSPIIAAERFYHVAKNDSQLNRNQQQLTLRDSVRETIVRRDRSPEVIYGVDDCFTHEELELLHVPVSSVVVDRLLPRRAVRPGDSYAPDSDVLLAVLNLSSVEACDVKADVVEIDKASAKIHFRGNLEGSVEGVPTTIRTVGKLMFDRSLGTCTWLAMAVHETREIGKAEPGFDIAATIKILRKPLARTIALSADPPTLNVTAPIPQDRLFVELRSDEVGVSVLMNRSWRMMHNVPGSATMRMIENDRSIAQCDFRPLSNLAAGSHWTLEAFQAEVRQTLGDQLTELVEADQRLSDSGLRVLRVTARGAVEGIPIQWILLHFSK